MYDSHCNDQSHGASHQSGIEWLLTHALSFIDDHHILLLLDEDGERPIESASSLKQRELVLVAGFIRQSNETSTELSGYLERMLEGYVLQNTLFLKDISLAARRFQNWTVFFDTRFLLRALGLATEPLVLAAREAISVLRLADARLAVFTVTIDEIKRILRLYASKLATSQGMKSLWPGELTQFFFTNKYSRSDVEQAALTLDADLKKLGIAVREVPPHQEQFTLDEKGLAACLSSDAPGDESSPRVRHDVDCVASVLSLRRGHRFHSLDNAMAVFATTTGIVVKNVGRWYADQREESVPPIVHQLALSNLAWLKCPRLTSGLKLLELIAACSAVLQPTKETWNRFLDHLRKLESSGSLTSDEMIAVLTSDFAYKALVETDEENDVDAATIAEVVSRVKESYRAEANERIRETELSARESVQAVQRTSAVDRERRRSLELAVRRKAEVLATAICWALSGAAALAIVGGFVFMIPGLFPESGAWRKIAYGSVGVLGLITVYNLMCGGHLWFLRAKVQRWVADRVAHWLTTENA